jgi:two-component system response regulator AtoC
MPLPRLNETDELRELPPIEVFFGQSPLMASAREKLERVAETAIPVLIQGESGTGKEIFAIARRAPGSKLPVPRFRIP